MPQDSAPIMTGDKPVTTAVSLSPNQWLGLQEERQRRGRGTNISMLVREAIEAHFGYQDEVNKPGGYERTDEHKQRLKDARRTKPD